MLNPCPLIFLKKFKIFILPLAGVRQYHKIIQKSRHDPQEFEEKLGILPEGYIYPEEERPVRDLLRRMRDR